MKSQVETVRSETVALAIRAKPFSSWLKVKDGTELVEPQLVDLRSSMVAVKELRKELEVKRKSYTDPLNGVVKRINAECKTADAPLAALETHCKGLLTQSLEAQQRAALAEVARRAKAEERKGNMQYAEDLRANAISQVTVAGNGVSTRVSYRAKVTDLAKLLLAIPDLDSITSDALVTGFIEVAEKVFSARARQAKTTKCDVPGVEFLEEKIVAVSA